MNISEMMEQGLPISPQLVALNVERFVAARKEYEENGLMFMLPKIDAAIAKMEAYSSSKQKKPKARKLGDIQSSIDESQKLVEGYRAARNYKFETEWKKNVAEYEREYMEAVDGLIYVPDITHNGTLIGVSGKG